MTTPANIAARLPRPCQEVYTIKKTRRKDKSLFATLIYCSYLCAGSILHPVYRTGVSPLIGFAVPAACLILFSHAAASYFSRREMRNSLAFFPLAAALCVFSGAVGAWYVDALDLFDRDYGARFVVIGAGAGLVACGTYAAARGKRSVCGTAFFALPVFVLWTVFGMLAFLSPVRIDWFDAIGDLSATGGTGLAKCVAEIVYLCADATLGILVLRTEEKSEKEPLHDACTRGAVLFVLLTGAELARNLLLFGTELTVRARDPSLAAVRLLPHFSFPEMSVLVHTFAAVLRLGFYLYLAGATLRESGAARENEKRRFGALGLLTAVSMTAFYLCRQEGRLLDGAGIVAFAAVLLAAGCAFAVVRRKK